MATLTRINPSEAGVTSTGVAATGGGDVVENADGKTMLLVHNGGGGSINVTIAVQTASFNVTKVGQVTKTSIVRAVAAGARELIGPFPPGAYNTVLAQLAITYSGVTSLFITAIKLP